MREFIGVRGLHNIVVEDLKKDLLFFDRLYIIGLNEVLFEISNADSRRIARPYIDFIIYDFYRRFYSEVKNVSEYLEYLINELKYLIDQGKVILNYKEVIPHFDADQLKSCFDLSTKISNYALNTKPKIENEIGFTNFISLMHELSIRQKTYYIDQNKDVDAYPIIEKFTPINELETKKQEIIKIAINNIPLPDDKTSWEQIFDFKNDPESKNNLLGLKTWINKIAKSNLNIKECEEEFEYLLNKYDRAIKLHKLKMQSSILETVIVGGAELLENIAKLKLGKIANSIFKARREQIELMEVELKSEGSELSYLLKTRNEFNK